MATSAFVNPGYEKGRAFSLFFFASPDFNIGTLKSLTRANSRLTKDKLAEELSRDLYNEALDPLSIIRAYIRQPRQWLSIKIGNSPNYPSLQDPQILLTEPGTDGWYGPIKDEQNNPRWYIHSLHINHFFKQGERTISARVRWLTNFAATTLHIPGMDSPFHPQQR
jgi:hypothetical protein